MPALNWTNFKSLPGDAPINFENLCRGIVRSNFGRYGKFSALKNQPGVEYHINLTEDCDSLGDKSRWFGWQCKWFELNKDKSLKAASKKDIIDSLDKTMEHVPDITDWVLWTPFTLSKKDQVWFNELELKYKFSLHLWAEEEVDNLLSGTALMLRKTYFEELILTPVDLARQHQLSIQPIKDRWLIPVHQEVSAESEIKEMLAIPGAWSEMLEVGESLKFLLKVIMKYETQLFSYQDIYKYFIDVSQNFLYLLENFHELLVKGDLEVIHQWLKDESLKLTPEINVFPRLLRKLKLPIALEAVNVVDDIRIACRLFESVKSKLNIGVVAVLADAGGGKTQLAAQLTSENDRGVAGVFIQGKVYTKHSTLDDLAKTIKINGMPIATFESLLAAVDSAAKRASCRLPIIIDGLNEAEDPRMWKDPLAQLIELMKEYPNVLLVCTLRTGELSRRNGFQHNNVNQRESFAEAALPVSINRIESDGFGENTREAIKDYLDYFNIDSGDTEFPLDFFKRPITLRIFCEATNPERKQKVIVDYFPSSLPSLFEKYLDNTCNRISIMTNLKRSYTSEDIKQAFYILGQELWLSGSRECDEKKYRNLIEDEKDWESSVVNLLAQDGIIFRDPGGLPGSCIITPVYDALGGYLIADYLLLSNPDDNELNWFKQDDVKKFFSGDDCHSLANDIFRSLVSLVPKRLFGTQLWKVVPEEYKEFALLLITELDGPSIDQESVDELIKLQQDNPDSRSSLYRRIRATRGSPLHPINSDFLTKILFPMEMGERDIYWAEWLRKYHDLALKDILNLRHEWESNLLKRTESDKLKATWVMWALSSTSHKLRSEATKALYWFGKGDVSTIFDLCLFSLKINDPYVCERVLAAGYGVAIDTSVCIGGDTKNKKMVFDFSKNLFNLFFMKNSKCYTTHIRIRNYCSRIIELANYYDQSLFSEVDFDSSQAPYNKEFIVWQKVDEVSKQESPFFMDFENYSIGRLVSGRGNYDYDHEGYKDVKSQLLWRVHDLGWLHGVFKDVDKNIYSSQYHSRMGSDHNKIDRYGKKYSWLAYYELVGNLVDAGKLSDSWRYESSDIDISFPDKETNFDYIEGDFIALDLESDEEWIKTNTPPSLEKYLQYSSRDDEKWILLDGALDKDDEKSGRKIFCFINAYFIKNKDLINLIEKLPSQDFESHTLPEKSNMNHVSLSEISWSNNYKDEGDAQFSFKCGEEEVFVKQPKARIINNEEGTQLIFESQDEETPVLNPIYEYVDCYIPVCSIPKDVGDESEGSLTVLARNIIDKYKLTTKSQSFEMYTPDGKVAAYLLGNNKNAYKNYDSFYYLRKDLLDEYLASNNMSLVWIVWGERSLSNNKEEHDGGFSSGHQTYSIYNQVKVYGDSVIPVKNNVPEDK